MALPGAAAWMKLKQLHHPRDNSPSPREGQKFAQRISGEGGSQRDRRSNERSQRDRRSNERSQRDRRSKQCEPDQVALRGDLWYSKSSSFAMARAIALAVSIPLPLSFVTSNIHDPPFSGVLRTIGSGAAGWSDVPAANSSLERQSRSNLLVRTSVPLPANCWKTCPAASRPPQKFAARISDPPGGRVNLTGDGQRLVAQKRFGAVNVLQESETVRSTSEFQFPPLNRQSTLREGKFDKGWGAVCLCRNGWGRERAPSSHLTFSLSWQ